MRTPTTWKNPIGVSISNFILWGYANVLFGRRKQFGTLALIGRGLIWVLSFVPPTTQFVADWRYWVEITGILLVSVAFGIDGYMIAKEESKTTVPIPS
jgi:hypothetical protein